jgi:hypothetical protein
MVKLRKLNYNILYLKKFILEYYCFTIKYIMGKQNIDKIEEDNKDLTDKEIEPIMITILILKVKIL